MSGIHVHHAGGADNVPLVAGLDWTPHDAPGGGGIGHVRIAWRGAHADLRRAALPSSQDRVPAADLPSSQNLPAGEAGSLLAQMCLVAERRGHDTGGLRVWVARVREAVDNNDDDGDGAVPTRWWLGGTDNGGPSRTVPEEIHDTLAELVNALAGIAATSELAGLGVCAAAADALCEALAVHGPEIADPVICRPQETVGESDADRPRFEAARSLPPMAAACLATLAAATLAGFAWLGGFIGASAQPEPVAAVYVAPLKGAGRAACGKGLSMAWPRMPGWTVSGTGCARPAYLPPAPGLSRDLPVPGIGSSDLVIWRAWRRDDAANAVLADAAADELVAGWDGGAHGRGHIRRPVEPLYLWLTARLLSEAWADQPGAVSRSGATLTVEVADPPAQAFARLGAEPGAGPDVELLSVIWAGGRTTMRLRPRPGEVM